MRQKSGPPKPPAETVVKDIRRRTRKQHSAEEKIRIVLEGLRGEPPRKLRADARCYHRAKAQFSTSDSSRP